MILIGFVSVFCWLLALEVKPGSKKLGIEKAKGEKSNEVLINNGPNNGLVLFFIITISVNNTKNLKIRLVIPPFDTLVERIDIGTL